MSTILSILSIHHKPYKQYKNPNNNPNKNLSNNLNSNLSSRESKNYHGWQHTYFVICFFSLLILANNQVLASSVTPDHINKVHTAKVYTNEVHTTQKHDTEKQSNQEHNYQKHDYQKKETTDESASSSSNNQVTKLEQVLLTDISAGQLLFTHANKTKYYQAPTLKNDVSIFIQGVVANATVLQTFKNTTEQWQHALYVFPLPDNAAINGLKITVNEREILGVIKEKQSAKKIFSDAKVAGKKAALLEQVRPNMFSMNIANIPPNESIEVELTYFQQVDIKQQNNNSVFSLDYPMAITPRFTPNDHEYNDNTPSIPTLAYQASQNVNNETSDDNISLNNFRTSISSHKVNFSLTLESGAEINNIRSLYHSVVLEKKANNTFKINMPLEPLEKDFELQWTYKKNPLPKVVNFISEHQGDNYGLLMVFPSNQSTPIETQAGNQSNNQKDNLSREKVRQLTFIFDTSGSMSGESLKQAKRAIKHGLKTLKKSDYIQLITFNNKANQFFTQPVLATKRHKRMLNKHVTSLSANGGTNIKEALHIALPSNNQANPEQETSAPLEQIIFLTDGAVGNEAEIFTMINNNIENKRLFTVGLGSAPNRYFMKKAAQVGRGSYHFIGSASELTTVMARLFKQLSQPVLTNIAFSLSNITSKAQSTTQPNALPKVTTSPNPIPDLYADEPIILSYKIEGGIIQHKQENASELKAALSADFQNTQWHYPFILSASTIDSTLQTNQHTQSTTQAVESIPALATLWAKRKIDDHYNALMLNRNSQDKADIIALALKFNLVSPFTSFVAVDTKMAKPINEQAQNKQLTNNLPAGQRLPQTALEWKKQLLSAVVFLLLAISMLILSSRYKASLFKNQI